MVIIMKKVILFITLILFSLTLTACSFSLSQFMPETNEYLSDTEKVTVTKSDYYYAFKPKEYITGIIFYTKSETNVTDYAELMHKLAILGYITFILKSNENNYIESVFNNYTNVSNWYIGGHADGGIDASNYIYNNI